MPGPGTAQPEKDGDARTPQQALLQVVHHYWKEIAATAMILVGGGGLFAYVQHTQDAAEREAWRAFFVAEYRADGRQGEVLAKELSRALKDHGHTRAAFYARLQALKAHAEQGEVNKAVAAAQRFLEAHPDHDFTPYVHVMLAKLYMAKGAYEEARRELDAVKTPGPLAPEIALCRAQCRMQEADAATDEADYKRRLELAREAYLNADARMEKGWPREIGELARFSLVLVRDRIAHPERRAARPDLVVPEDGETELQPSPEAPPAPAEPLPEEPDAPEAEGDAPEAPAEEASLPPPPADPESKKDAAAEE